MPPTSEYEQKLRTLSWVASAGAGFVLFFVISMSALMLWQAYRLGENSATLRQVAIETHESICALREDVQKRYDASVKYLKDNPAGLVDKDGSILVSADEIKRSQDNQAATLDALADLNCD